MKITRLLFFLCVACFVPAWTTPLFGQTLPPAGGLPGGTGNNLFSDSTGVDSMSTDWVDEQAKIYYKTLRSEIERYPDTSLSRMHRFQHVQPWWGSHLGTYGSAARNLFFSPNMDIGPSLGYHQYDLYKLQLDSLRFYNTTRPYSDFYFMLGSKDQQNVGILHTQNIRPNWNFAVQLRYQSAQGFYMAQNANNIAGSVNSHYASHNQRYQMKVAMTYNRFRQNENGGIASDSFLNLANFSDRRRIPVRFTDFSNSNNTSPILNTLRDFTFYVQNNYSWGKADTLYNEDSTKATYRFTPRFRLQYELMVQSEKHIYKDSDPDSVNYVPVGNFTFSSRDSVYGVQNWTYIDNKFSINGYLGKAEKLAHLKVGLANRLDLFDENFAVGNHRSSSVGNYLFGNIQKEALQPGQWGYQAAAQFFFTGKAAGNFRVELQAGKELSTWGLLAAGLRQSLKNAPYGWEHFTTNYYAFNTDLPNTSITDIWGRLNLSKLKIEITANNKLITNYLYYNSNTIPTHESQVISVFQIYARKKLTFGIFSLDNEVVWQRGTDEIVGIPELMLREQFAVEAALFKQALKVAAGVEVFYATPYKSYRYSPYRNQYFNDGTWTSSPYPEVSAFFNFKVRNFRAFVLGGQLQQFLVTNNRYAPGYPYGNALFRFGFHWVLIN